MYRVPSQSACLTRTLPRPARILFALLFAIPGLTLAARTTAHAQQPLQGTFALQGQTAQSEGHLIATAVPGKSLNEKLDFWMTEPNRTVPFHTYQTEMTKKLHMIVVSNDFKTFMHLHPTLGPNGHLVLTQAFPAKGTYLIYTDGLPNQLNHQVFRFALDVGGPSSNVRNLPATGMGVQVGPYEVDLSSIRLKSGQMSMVDINIVNAKDGKPATDLHPYLGSPAHAVFLNVKDLTYVHAHPMAAGQMMMDMSKDPPPMPENGPSPADMMLHLALREPGTYKLWLQFRGGTQLYIAEFTITAL